jgi:thymidine kinase
MPIERRQERTDERKAEKFFAENGSVEIIFGGMFSGKSEELIDRLEKVKITLDIHVAQGNLTEDDVRDVIKAFKPRLDKRYSDDKINSHSGRSWPAILVDEKKPEEVFEYLTKDTLVVGIDEAQFFDHDLVEVCDTLADMGIRVVLAGLDTNFRGETFGPMGDLIARAEKKDQTTALCMICGKTATRTQRIFVEEIDGNVVRKPADYSEEEVVVGATEKYEARCRKHHEVPGKPREEFK